MTTTPEEETMSTTTTNAVPLFRIRVKSLTHPDGDVRDVCSRCADHARYIAESQGPRWYIRGNPFEKVQQHSVGIGECPDCDYRRDAESRWDRRNGG
jgi:hypothetical protein